MISSIDRLIDFPAEIDSFFDRSSEACQAFKRQNQEKNRRNAQVFLFILIVSQVVVGIGRVFGGLGFPFYNLFITAASIALSLALRFTRIGQWTTQLSVALFAAWAATFPFFIIRLGGYTAPTYPVYIIIILYILVFFHYSFPQYVTLFGIIYLSNMSIFLLQPEIDLEEFLYRQVVMAIVVGVGVVGSYINVRTRQREFHSRFVLQKQKEELEIAYQKLSEAELLIVQSEKLASLGKMSAGMAHEINNPLGFIAGNLESLATYVADLKRLWENIENLNLDDSGKARVNELWKQVDYDYLAQDVDQCLASARRGTQRIEGILAKLKHFSRLDEATYKLARVEECLESALSMLDHKGIAIDKAYGETPQVHCMPALLNQVFHSILENAVDAIRSHAQADPLIRISSMLYSGPSLKSVVVTISDNGIGMDAETVERIFDPFFTTKQVGEGQGLGLSVAHGIMAEHGGTISCTSLQGQGSQFCIRLPTSK